MGIWVGEPALGESETVVWKQNANRTQSGARAAGGRLYLTGTRLLFEPNRLDAISGGQRWSASLDQIRGADSQSPDGRPFSGGMRTRLRLALADGTAELFVVNKLSDVIKTIQEAITRSG